VWKKIALEKCQGLARVRKELPPPGKIFKSKKKNNRQQSKEKLRRELLESLL
jgi:hypothetical protein